MFKKVFPVFLCTLCTSFPALAQNSVQWTNVDALYQPLPPSVKVYKTVDALDGKPNVAYYIEADLNDRSLLFSADTTLQRRLTPAQFYQKNNEPLVVVNTTFFSFQTHQNLNVVIKDGKTASFDPVRWAADRNDTTAKIKAYNSAIGISRKRKADVAWTQTDSSKTFAYATQGPLEENQKVRYKKWKMQTAVGGGPVLLQKGEIQITNNEERKFAGKAINDRHPRTAMGYTADGKLIILVVQGRMAGVAEGASLTHLAQLLKDVGCVEALNLDGGGSTCLLINGKESIAPSDKVQRAVPAVFMIQLAP